MRAASPTISELLADLDAISPCPTAVDVDIDSLMPSIAEGKCFV